MSERDDIQEVQVNDFGDDLSADKAKDTKKTSLRLLKQLMRQKWKLLIVFLSTIGSSLFMILSPRVSGEAINQIYDGIKNAVTNGTKFQVNLDTILTVAAMFVMVCGELSPNIFPAGRQFFGERIRRVAKKSKKIAKTSCKIRKNVI